MSADSSQISAKVPRNLALQPEALKLSRRLGRRYRNGNEISTMVGVLTVDSQERVVNITRKQTIDGEEIGVTIPGSRSLTWSRMAVGITDSHANINEEMAFGNEIISPSSKV